MKFNFKGIRFQTWLYFFLFSTIMLSLLGLLLVLLIKPYYRNSQLETIDILSKAIENSLISKNPTKDDINNIYTKVVNNNVCTLVLSENGNVVYSQDGLGELCMLSKDISIDGNTLNPIKRPHEIIEYLKHNDLNETLNETESNYEMLLYGKLITNNLANYYILINSPLEPVESYVDFILSQFSLIALFIVLISMVVAFLLATRFSKPIVNMQKEASKLIDGDYNVDFNNNNHLKEIDDLANTLDKATDKLSKVDELRKDLVANVSHDIKTPLTMIQAYAEMIRDISGDDEAKRNEHIDVILQETNYLNRLITDMQEYSKMQAGYITLNRSNFDLKECCEKVVNLLNHLIEQKKIKLICNFESVIVFADEIKISQVIYNFLSNAIKHSNDDSIIVINTINRENDVRVEVIDNGDGIAKDAIEYIWDRYYKIDKSFNRSQNSTGLGLAICKAILEAHKAKYGVESEIGKGSKFYFELSKDYDEM